MDKGELQTVLLREEGEVLHVYPDSLGYATICVGHLVDPRKGGKISQRISRLILDEDMDEKWAELVAKAPWVAGLDTIRQNTLVAMAFQLGVDGLLAFKNANAAMVMRQWDTAADEYLDSLWARQTPDRAQRMATRIRTGVA